MLTQLTVLMLLSLQTLCFINESEDNQMEHLPLYGVVLHNINNEDLLPQKQTINTLIQNLTNLIHEYGFVVLKNISIDHNQLLQIASNFGDVSNFKQGKITQHFGSPHHLISAISNNPFFGNAFGDGAWHNDGFFQFELRHIVLQYTISGINKQYGTQIISSENILNLLQIKNKTFYDILKNVSIINIMDNLYHPLILKHPITKKDFIYIARLLVYHSDSYKLMLNHKIIDRTTSVNILFKLENFIENECRDNNLIYITENQTGDLLIRDNLAFIHKSHPSSYHNNINNLKVLWRTDTTKNHNPWIQI